MPAKRIKDPETGEEIVLGKDNRKMHPKSLANLTTEGRWPKGVSGNPNGRRKDPIRVVREKLSEVLTEEYWKVNPNNEQTVMLMLKDAVEQYFNCKNANEKQNWFKMLVGSIESAGAGDQTKSTAITAQNVIFLPEKSEPVPLTMLDEAQEPQE